MRSAYRNAAIIFLNAAVALVLLNLALGVAFWISGDARWREYVYFLGKAYPAWSRAEVGELAKESWADSWCYDEVAQLKLCAAQGRYVNISRSGFRWVKNQGPWPPDSSAVNVFVFGGSTAFGQGVADGETIASDLQALADADHPRQAVHVYNFGVPAYQSTQEMLAYLSMLRAHAVPRVAIFIDGLNDAIIPGGWRFGADLAQRIAWGDRIPAGAALSGLPVMRFARALAARLPARGRSAQGRPQGEVVSGVLSRWQTNKKLVEEMAAAHRTRVLFVWQPVPLYKYGLKYHFLGSDQSAVTTNYFHACDLLRPVYAEFERRYQRGDFGGDVLFLGDMQADLKENLYVDPVHYNARGSALIAGRIYEFLKSAGALTHDGNGSGNA